MQGCIHLKQRRLNREISALSLLNNSLSVVKGTYTVTERWQLNTYPNIIHGQLYSRRYTNLLKGEMLIIQLLEGDVYRVRTCLLYTSPSPRDKRQSRMPSSA